MAEPAAAGLITVRLTSTPDVSAAPSLLPACTHLPAALSTAAQSPFRATAQALSRLAPRLTWTHRALANPADLPFWDGHANAMLLGTGGLEARADLWIGLSLIAPGVTYPDHDHGPEEAYLFPQSVGLKDDVSLYRIAASELRSKISDTWWEAQ